MASQQKIAGRLGETFGITVPAPFVRLVWIASMYGGDRIGDFFAVIFEFSSAVANLKGAEREPPTSGHLVTPPELFEFGGAETDGAHYGFVVHAPELGQADYPLGELRPVGGDRRGVYRLGDDTRSGLEFLMSRVLHHWAENPVADGDQVFHRNQGRSDIAAIAEEIGVAPAAAKGSRPPDRITPEVPPGWRHVQSADGVGVLAPVDAFADRPPVVADPPEGVEAAIGDAQSMIQAGHPATALLGIRETFWRDHTSHAAFDAVKDVWAWAYHELGRPLLAEALEWKRV